MTRHLPLCGGTVVNTVLRDTQLGRQEGHRSVAGVEGTTSISPIFWEGVHSVDTKCLLISQHTALSWHKEVKTRMES